MSSEDEVLDADDEWDENEGGPPAPLAAWEDEGREDE